jgi:hypothetical protein
LTALGAWHGTCLGPGVPHSRNLWVAALVHLAFSLGCSDDQARTFEPRPGKAIHSVTTFESQNLDSIETDHVAVNGIRARVRCETCHSMVDIGDVAQSTKQLEEFHQGLQLSHGNLKCGSCHEPGSPLLLHLATGETIPMTDAMVLCSQCHGTQRRSYDSGSHGGMNGHWDLSRGPRLRNQCVHCHDAHAPQIATAMPVLPPRDRGQLPDSGAKKGGHE